MFHFPKGSIIVFFSSCSLNSFKSSPEGQGTPQTDLSHVKATQQSLNRFHRYEVRNHYFCFETTKEQRTSPLLEYHDLVIRTFLAAPRHGDCPTCIFGSFVRLFLPRVGVFVTSRQPNCTTSWEGNHFQC
jgi:hypothetical protein